MALDTPDQLAHEVLRYCPLADLPLGRRWVDSAFRSLSDAEDWSWKTKHGTFSVPDAYSTGTASIGIGENLIAFGGGATLSSAMIGLQFRSGDSGIYTIIAVTGTLNGTATIDKPWAAAALSAAGFEIYQAFWTAPSDFRGLRQWGEPVEDYELALDVTREQVDQTDPTRSESGAPSCVYFYDYSPIFAGSVRDPVAAKGTGDLPSSSGVYTGMDDATFIVEITTGGVTGTAIFKWKKDDGAYIPGLVSTEDAIELSDGVLVYFPSGQTYDVGDSFAIPARANLQSGQPRFEMWPHPRAARHFHFTYDAELPDLTEPSSVLPAVIRGDVLVHGALVECALWPGPSEKERNPYYVLGLGDRLALRFEDGTQRLRRVDAAIRPTAIKYRTRRSFGRSSAWHQSHDVFPGRW